MVRIRSTASPVILAKARTHTAESISWSHLVDDPANDVGLWLWVLDRASLVQDDSGVSFNVIANGCILAAQ